MCFRRLHVFHDSNMTMDSAEIRLETNLYWKMYRESLWTHLGVPIQHGAPAPIRRVLVFRRPGGRRLLNHDEISAMLQARGFEVRSITPDMHSLSVVASVTAQVSLLIGIGSAAYNAVFLPTGCGVLEICPTINCRRLYWKQVQPWQIGFHRLGVHQLVYACPHLNTRDFRYVASNSSDAVLGGTAGTLGVAPQPPPIVVSPRTIRSLLHDLVRTLEEVRTSGVEMGSIAAIEDCFPWESDHSKSWTPWHSPHDDDSAPRT
jgi:hypothetical protein